MPGALVTGILGIKAVGRGQASNRGVAISGVVLGGIFFAIVLVAVLSVL
ncbi:MAG: hypothetical protein FWD63_07845 [Propionibacteriaceae bacterium]|nr:hypothetical protein [Propionibacteriaceae bacterium]